MASNYDEYIKELDSGEKAETKEVENLYGDMQKDYEENIDKQIGAAEDWETKQTEIQNKNTDFVIEQINQQKEDTEKDYQKEQKAAYTDYQKQVDPYGVNAEQMAANGLVGSGYSESSKVTMYKAYQNRVAVARETYQRATVEFENAITQARLQNDAKLAEIAYQTYQTKLELTLKKLQTKNSLLLELADKKSSIKSTNNSLRLEALEKKAEQETEQTKLDELRILADNENLWLTADDDIDEDGLISESSVSIPETTGKSRPVPIFSNREHAISYLRENYDIPNANSLYTEAEWKSLKNSESSPAIIKESADYGTYLKWHAQYLIDQYAR